MTIFNGLENDYSKKSITKTHSNIKKLSRSDNYGEVDKDNCDSKFEIHGKVSAPILQLAPKTQVRGTAIIVDSMDVLKSYYLKVWIYHCLVLQVHEWLQMPEDRKTVTLIE
jgi:hypothetical protein